MRGFRMQAFFWVALALIAALTIVRSPPAHADSLAQHFKDEYQNKNWFLANFYGDDELRYDSDGQIMADLSPGVWTADGYVRVTGIDVSNQQLRIKAERLALYDEHGNGFIFQETERKLVIDVQLDPQHMTAQDLDALWAKIFIMRVQRFVDSVPDFWKPCVSAALTGSGGETYKTCHFARGYTGPAIDETLPTSAPPLSAESKGPLMIAGYGLVYRKGEGITPANATYAPGPEYSEAARKAKISAGIILEVVVDASGHAGDIHISRPAGYGLDEQAVKTIEDWKFEPATKDGHPVPSLVDIEVTFDIAD
jgi:TonB family protein